MKPEVAVGILVTLCIVAGLYFQYHQTALTPEEAARAVLAETDGEIVLARLPLQQAIIQRRGDGALALVTFEDPNCPYCARLDAKLSRLDNAVIYTFLIPILSDDSAAKSRRIWCAPDRAMAWNEWMLKRRIPDHAGDCDASALDRNLELSDSLGIRGVPALYRGR
ncbi:MAG: DsbC family protein [Azoarcus sp.]|jgi:thiol:disulfide interchange protein DsbC|nr:DsbC family protein [Azoarcus sp.]